MGLASFLRKYKTQIPDDVTIVADLDRLISAPIYFKLQGKTHQLEPITVERFLELMQGMNVMDILRQKHAKGDTVSKEELYAGYSEVFKAMCKTVGRAEVNQMTESQIGALFQLVLNCVTGKAYVEETQKKNIKLTGL